MKTIRERLSEKAARNRVPIMSAFELLPVCNLKCKMCYVRKDMSEVTKAGGLKDAEWWLNLAREASEYGLLYPLLTGGEPFLHPHFFEILSGMSKMGLQVSINSNGTLIDRNVVAQLCETPPVRINLTLYGASEETYEKLCGDGNAYNRMRQGVELLKESRIPVKFNASITSENVHDMEKMISFAQEQESPIQVATYMFPPIRRDENMVGKNHRLSPEEAAMARVKADFLQNDPEWFVAQAYRYQQFTPVDRLNLENDTGDSLGIACRAGLCSFWIDWQGNMINCGMYGSSSANLEEKGFKAAWDDLVKETAEVRYKPHCVHCPNRPLCHPCIAMVSNECGKWSGRPEYVCQMNEAQARYYKEYVELHYPNIKFKNMHAQPRPDICEL